MVCLQCSDQPGEEFSEQPEPSSSTGDVCDIEELAGGRNKSLQPIVNVAKRKRTETGAASTVGAGSAQNWRDALGRPPPMGNSKVSF